MLADSGAVAGRPNPPASWVGAQPARQLQQGERVSARLGDDPLQHAFIQPSRQDRLQQRSRITTTQGHNMELRQTGERVPELSCREHKRDLLRDETTSHKAQGLRGRTIEPLRVVNDTHKWLLLRGLGQQAEDRQSNQERIRRGPRPQSERDPSASRWGCGQPLLSSKNGEHSC